MYVCMFVLYMCFCVYLQSYEFVVCSADDEKALKLLQKHEKVVKLLNHCDDADDDYS